MKNLMSDFIAEQKKICSFLFLSLTVGWQMDLQVSRRLGLLSLSSMLSTRALKMSWKILRLILIMNTTF